jgi:hypothetical protein
MSARNPAPINIKLRRFIFAAVFTVCRGAFAGECETNCTNSDLMCITGCGTNNSCSKECLKKTERCMNRCAKQTDTGTPSSSQCDAEFQSLAVVNDGSSSVFNMGAGSYDCRDRICIIDVLFKVKNQDGNWTGPWSATFTLDNQTEQKQQVPAGGRFDEYPEVQVESIKCN